MKGKDGRRVGKLSPTWLALQILALVLGLWASSAGCGSVVSTGGSGGTDDTGTGGMASTSTGDSGGAGGSGAGGGMACSTPQDCPLPAGECVTPTCLAGMCGTANVAADTPISAQAAGDCQKAVCDGQGAVVSVDDDTDMPDDGNVCTNDTCVAGVPSHAPAADGMSCSSGQICNLGSCVSGCLIGATFYAAGTANPANGCDLCTPASSTSTWTPQADGTACLFGMCAAGSCIYNPITYVKASNTGAYGDFGYSVALSGDGNTLAVGAYQEASAATGINGNQADNSAGGAGAVYVFTRSGGTWAQQAYIKASNTGVDHYFGQSVALSSDGNTLAVGANRENSNATGINGNQADDSATVAGAVYVFTRSGGTWSQQAYVKASNTGTFDRFGQSVALSGDGDTLAAGAFGEASNATGINGNQADDSAAGAGAVYVFTRSGGTWAQQAYVKASNTGVDHYFGQSVALSSDGNTLAVGANREDSDATGINGNQADDSATAAGAVYVFTRSGGTWAQQAYVKASNTSTYDIFGDSVALSGDGNTLAVGANREGSNATGIDGNQADDSAGLAGAVYVFARSGGTWAQQAYVKASNTGPSDKFGQGVALSGDGNTLAVGAQGEASNATTINGNQADNSAPYAGAVYVFTRSGGTWVQQAYVKASNTGNVDWFGYSVALSGDGNTLAASAFGEDSAATGINGNQADNSAYDAGAVYVY